MYNYSLIFFFSGAITGKFLSTQTGKIHNGYPGREVMVSTYQAGAPGVDVV